VVAHDACLSSVHAGKPGRGAENKAWFMAAVELDSANHPQHVRFDPPPDLTDASVSAWARTALHASVHLVTDGLASLAAAAPHVAAYGAIVLGDTTSSKLEVFRWVNTYISNLKTAITGTYHHIDVEKYRARYLAEAQYRVNRRVDLHSLLVSSRQGCASNGTGRALRNPSGAGSAASVRSVAVLVIHFGTSSPQNDCARRQPLCPGSPCVRGATPTSPQARCRLRTTPSNGLRAFRMCLHMPCVGFGTYRPLRQLRPYARTYAYADYAPSLHSPWRAARDA
jgi:hypothetical protein